MTTTTPAEQFAVRTIALDEVPDDAMGGPLQAAANPLHEVELQIQVCVGAAELTVGQLLAARDGEVVRLDRGLDDPVDLLLHGKVVARGRLVAVDDSFAVQITDLPLPLGL